MDCFVAEFIIGPAQGGTRWLLAMTRKQKALATVPKSEGRGVWVPAFRGDDIEIVHSRTGERSRSDLPTMANQIRAFGLRQINPTGKSLLIFRNRVKPPKSKYSAFAAGQISARTPAIPSHQRGDRASSRARGGMRWTRQRQASNSEPDE